jgi:hypothetical protein
VKRNKEDFAGDVRAVSGHRDKVSYSSAIIKARGLIKG